METNTLDGGRLKPYRTLNDPQEQMEAAWKLNKIDRTPQVHVDRT